MNRIAYLSASVLAGVVLVVATAALCFRIHSEPPRLLGDRDAWPDDVEFQPDAR